VYLRVSEDAPGWHSYWQLSWIRQDLIFAKRYLEKRSDVRSGGQALATPAARSGARGGAGAVCKRRWWKHRPWAVARPPELLPPGYRGDYGPAAGAAWGPPRARPCTLSKSRATLVSLPGTALQEKLLQIGIMPS